VPMARADITVEVYRDGALRSSTQAPVEIPFYLPSFADGKFPNQLPYKNVSLGSNWGMQSGEWHFSQSGVFYQLQWQSASAQFPPNRNHEQ